MRLFLLAFILFPILQKGVAQTTPFSNTGAEGIAVGNAMVAYSGINSIFSNQAGLTNLQKVSASLYAEQRYLNTALKGGGFGMALPTHSGVFGLKIAYFGWSELSEQQIGITYSRRLFEQLSIGAQVHYHNFRSSEFGQNGLLSFEVGLLYNVLNNLSLGVHVSNPIRQEIVSNDPLSAIFKAGISWKVSKVVLLLGEIEKNYRHPARIKGGLDYTVFDKFHLRMGIKTQPSEISFGIGYQPSTVLQLDLSSAYHQILGFMPSVGLRYGG